MPVLGALGAVSSVTSSVGSIMGGLSANSAAKQEAALQRQQGDIAQQEANVNAQNEAYNQTQAVQNQRVAYLANGVSLEGSPSMVLEVSKAYGQSQVDAILRQGAARKTLAYGEADVTSNKGRAALIGGFLQAGSTLTGAASKAYESGMLDPNKKTADTNPGIKGYRNLR